MIAPFDILATKGLRPIAHDDAAKAGCWYMTSTGWKQHGSDRFEPYDKHKVALAPMQPVRTMNRVAVLAAKAVVVALLPVCVAVRAGWL